MKICGAPSHCEKARETDGPPMANKAGHKRDVGGIPFVNSEPNVNRVSQTYLGIKMWAVAKKLQYQPKSPAVKYGAARQVSLKDEIGSSSMTMAGRLTPEDLSGDTPRLESRNTSSARLAFRLLAVGVWLCEPCHGGKGESRSCLNIKPATHFDVPEKLKAIQKAVKAKPAAQPQNYLEAVARPKLSAAAAPKTPGPEVQSRANQTLIVSSRCENQTAEQMVAKLRRVVDARKMGVAVDRPLGA
ncbi:hypothetical protein EVAR_66982_1 [Eumeta japonica]|uniref:Uncharacterized protein n=1 Tax=Eumeta variegata TaxID=151549 RepID=A0A4C1ZXI4_EUMVA|nr:hypothetical protein EVAR_66982_1 [Eumeta japonica]